MQIVIDVNEKVYLDIMFRAKNTPRDMDDYDLLIANGTPLPKGHGRKFEEIVVEYPPAEFCTYPKYRGKPYFSIKYEENGEHIIGFGTYKPEVLSTYIQEYFIAPTITESEGKE